MNFNEISPFLVALLTFFLGIWFAGIRDKQKRYNVFKGVFWPFMHAIMRDDSSLNSEMLAHFPEHKNAAREYIENLKGKKKEKFIRLWNEYEAEYIQIKSLGVAAHIAAIAPSEIDLKNVKDPNEIVQWETDRANRIYKLIAELLKTAKMKVWI